MPNQPTNYATNHSHKWVCKFTSIDGLNFARVGHIFALNKRNFARIVHIFALNKRNFSRVGHIFALNKRAV